MRARRVWMAGAALLLAAQAPAASQPPLVGASAPAGAPVLALLQGGDGESSDGVGTVLSSETRDYIILGTMLLAVLAAGLADVRTRRRRGSAETALALAREEVRARTRQVEELREELRATCAALDDAVRASDSKTRFIGHVSHEFRTPLSSIIGFASLLSAEHTRLPAETRGEYVEIVLRNARHLLHVINDILNLSKVEAGTLEVTPAPVYVPEAVSAVVASLAPLAAERRIRVLTSDEGHHFAVADSGRLRQVIQNLLENALKYAPEGTTVRVDVSSTGDEVRIAVCDEGPGISPEDQGRLFKEFSRVNLPGVRVAGAGLGLALSKQIVELMGGRIGVDSRAGQGSEFWVQLPAGEPIALPRPAPAEPRPPPPGGRRGTVAVVDDDPDIRAFARVILENAGYRVLLDDGREGTAQRVCDEAPELVLLDMHLEGRGGVEALAEIRACLPLHHVPVIAFTAAGTPPDLARIRAAEFDGQLLKPVEPETLLRCVDSTISAARLRRSASAVPAPVATSPEPSVSVPRDEAPSDEAEPSADGGDDGDDYLAPLRERFRAGLPDRLGAMEDAVRHGDVDTLTREVHKLRGAAAGYGMDGLSHAAGVAEEALRGGSGPATPQVWALLRALREAAGLPRA
ncbi:MAG TPA: ATP-binding protein [Longimicrobiaceae bacterium]|nr:ATP-binding protein [Longimicrobiaceae bacterium]